MKCNRCSEELEPGAGKCPSCGAWALGHATNEADTVLLLDIAEAEYQRLTTGFWDNVFAEPPGVVTTGATLLGGEPGAGKSTFALQFAGGIIESTGGEVLYLPTEEIPAQIKPRALRLGLGPKLGKLRMVRAVDTDSDRIAAIVRQHPPRGIVLDSVSGVAPHQPHIGVEFAEAMKRIAQEHKCPVLLIDHITKADDFAGLMKLQHAVDTLIGLRSREDGTRILYAIKNRFGPTDKSRETPMTMGEGGFTPYVKKERKKKGKKERAKDENEDEDVF